MFYAQMLTNDVNRILEGLAIYVPRKPIGAPGQAQTELDSDLKTPFGTRNSAQATIGTANEVLIPLEMHHWPIVEGVAPC